MQDNKRNTRTVYLAGPMERAEDGGVGWRERVDQKLRGLGYRVYNPTSDEVIILEQHGLKSAQELLDLKKPVSLARYRECIYDIIQFDLERLSQCCAAVVKVDASFSGGTAAEATIMRYLLGRPVLGIIDTDKIPETSGWLLGCLTHLFKDEEACLDYISKYGL